MEGRPRSAPGGRGGRLKGKGCLIIFSPLAVFLLVISFIIVFGSNSPKREVDVCSPDAAAVSVNLANLPKGPIAGYSGKQLENAAYIMTAGKDMGLSLRDQQIGVMVAMGESGLTVLDHGDAVGPDSRGLFQQRDNGAWGSLSDRMDPYRSATSFFTALQAVTGRESMPPTLVANKVQRNADPYHYERFWPQAVQLTQGLAGVTARTATSAAAAPTGKTGSYNLPGVKPQTLKLANVVGGAFQIRDIGGVRPDPLPDHPSGHAVDLMVYKDKAKGDAMAKYVVANADKLGVKYLIWYQQIWSRQRADEGWRPMGDRGGITANHMDHVHVTLLEQTDTAAVTADGLPATTYSAGIDACVSSADSDESAMALAATSSGGWVNPTPGPITTPFGWRIHPIKKTRSFHHGVDIGAACGKPIRAAADGVVISAEPSAPYGQWLQIDHGGGKITRYGHMFNDGVLVRAGDKVKAGQAVAKVGSAGWSTGCHLHVEISVNGNDVDPVDYFAKAGAKLG